MSLIIRQIGPPTTELAALERLKYIHLLIMGQMVSPEFPPWLFFGPILLLLSGNENMHESLDDFEFSQDQATDYGVSCTLSV